MQQLITGPQITFRVKAILVALACFGLFVWDAAWLLWLRSRHPQELRSSPWYASYVTTRTLVLSPVVLLPILLIIILASARIYRLRSNPEKERQRLYLLALVCGTLLGF